MTKKILVIACGALAHELAKIVRLNRWSAIRLRCLSPELHNRPEEIPPAVRRQIEESRGRFAQIFVAYGDCGTGGKLDEVLREYDVERLPGAHCYEFYRGSELFRELADEEPGSFYLTDFLARHFDRLVRKGLGLDQRPELRDLYFGNYRRLVFLAQNRDPALESLARQHAEFLQLDFCYRYTGVSAVEAQLREQVVRWEQRAGTQGVMP
jgi:hypothetical protein